MGEVRVEQRAFRKHPEAERAELIGTLVSMGMTEATARTATEEIHRDETQAVNLHMITELGIDLVDAVTAAALTPARALSLEGVGSLAVGSRADVLVVDDQLTPLRVLRRGNWL